MRAGKILLFQALKYLEAVFSPELLEGMEANEMGGASIPCVNAPNLTGVLRGHLVFKRMRLHSLERMATMGRTWRSLPSMVVMGFSLKIRHTVFSKTVYS